jgi:hypothetical protein
MKLYKAKVDEYGMRFSLDSLMAIRTGDPDDYIQEINGTISKLGEDAEPVEDVGGVKAYLLKLGEACNNGVSNHDIFDCRSGEIYEYWKDLFDDDTQDWKDGLVEMPGDLLIISRVGIKEGHRGFGLGLAAVMRTIRVFSNGASVAMKPFPLQYEGKTDKEVNASQETADTKKLRDYWALAGFDQVGKSGIYLLDTALKSPTFDEIFGDVAGTA